jgi:hypothetical protein
MVRVEQLMTRNLTCIESTQAVSGLDDFWVSFPWPDNEKRWGRSDDFCQGCKTMVF